MRTQSSAHKGRNALAWIPIALLVSGCSSWHATPLTSAFPPVAPDTLATPSAPYGATLAAGLPDKVRVRLHDGTEITLDHPTIDGDSLRGINVPGPSRDRPTIGSGPKVEVLGHVPRAVALADIDRIDVRKFSGVNSLFLLVGVGAAMYLLVLIGYGLSEGNSSD